MLSNLRKIVENKGKRQGRGYGSGKGGHTVGKGSKGQKSRAGYTIPRPGFEGGQMPLSRRLPKLKGFSRVYFSKRNPSTAINISTLESFKDGDTVTVKSLKEKSLIDNKIQSVKVIGKTALSKKLNFEGINFSAAAKSEIEKAGGIIK